MSMVGIIAGATIDRNMGAPIEEVDASNPERYRVEAARLLTKVAANSEEATVEDFADLLDATVNYSLTSGSQFFEGCSSFSSLVTMKLRGKNIAFGIQDSPLPQLFNNGLDDAWHNPSKGIANFLAAGKSRNGNERMIRIIGHARIFYKKVVEGANPASALENFKESAMGIKKQIPF